MADICPRCSGSSISHEFNYAHCADCGASLKAPEDGSTKLVAHDSDLDWKVSQPADTSLATPTATPVYAEREVDRQPAVDTNLEPVPSDAKPGVNYKPAPDVEAVNVAGELSDETPEEKKSGGPDDQPRTADLTKAGKPTKDTMVDHKDDVNPASLDLTEDEVAARTKLDSRNAKAAEKAAKARK